MVLAWIFYVAWMGCMVASMGGKISLPEERARIAALILGIVFFVLDVACLYCFLTWYAKEDRETRVEEQDERNQMIRGRAAENAHLFVSVSLVIVMFILMFCEEWTGVWLAGAVNVAGNLLNLLLIGYYQKKY